MADSSRNRSKLRWPIIFTISIVTVNVALMVVWIVVFATLNVISGLAIGTAGFSLILVFLTVYFIYSINVVRLNQRQANFIDSVTHELKTPIASLRLYLETLEMRELNREQRREFYGVMENELERLNQLINQLLEVARLDAIGQDMAPEDISLEPLLRRCASTASAHHKCDESEVFSYEFEPVVIHARPIILEMIFGNLIDNAVKYSAPDPKIQIKVRAGDQGRVLVSVADNGCGIRQEDQKKIFKIFYRSENELQRTKKGTGLGLYIVRTLVRMLKGKINIRSQVNGPGSIFEIDLPGRTEA